MQERDRYERLYQLFQAAIVLPPADREAFLDRECVADSKLADEVRQLLVSAASSSTAGSPDTDSDPVGGAFTVEISPPRPVQIGPYRILDTLGEGGMGSVYLAEQDAPVRRKVAVKVIKVGMNTREVVSRFEAERQALALMSHENIARVFDAGETPDGRPYFAMEHVPGLPLTEYCDSRRLTTKERLALFAQVCDAVQHAHQKGIIHRDLKPSNVLVMDQGDRRIPKVIDFGVAKAINQRLTAHTVFTNFGQLVGTLEYMSPEQADLRSEDIDTRTDIYSLGVLLYELLVGCRPLDSSLLRDKGLHEIQRVIRDEEPPRPSTRLMQVGETGDLVAKRQKTDLRSLERELRQDLDWIAMKAIDKDRLHRYPSASELAGDVRRYLNDEPVSAGPPSGLYRLRKLFRKHRRKAMVAAAIVLPLSLFPIYRAYVAWETRATLMNEARKTLEEGKRSLAVYRAALESTNDFQRQWRQAEAGTETWQPLWERSVAVSARKQVIEARRQLDLQYVTAVARLVEAMGTAPSDTSLRAEILRTMEEAHWERFREASIAGSIQQDAGIFSAMASAIGMTRQSQLLAAPQDVRVDSQPPGAEVYCFRYVEQDERLLPLPFVPRGDPTAREARTCGAAFLDVERIWAEERTPFQVHDRLLRVKERQVSTLPDLAEALAKVQGEEQVRCRVRRGHAELDLTWAPFPRELFALKAPFVGETAKSAVEEELVKSAYKAGRLINPLLQLGVTFSAYPLEFIPGNLAGTTTAQRGVALSLPPGSYLIVLRKEGCVETRYPLSVPSDIRTVTLKLPAVDEVPPGFVYVPEGTFLVGGDREAFQSLDGRAVDVKGFFLQRCEVTIAEYLEFLNARAVPASGDVNPSNEVIKSILRERKLSKVVLKPGLSSWTRRQDGTWQCDERYLASPVSGIPFVAALEYAGWKTEVSGGRFRFRLPTDLEWEKAARGVDRRIHVWGNVLVWTFCVSANSFPPAAVRFPAATGMAPFDESIYGVRDLAGSVAEWTSDKSHWRYEYRCVRGGHYNTVDDYEFRTATRNGQMPEQFKHHIGFRLAAVALE